MKTRIGFFVMAFLLLASVNAHSADNLGPSCKSKHMPLRIHKYPQVFGTSWCWAATAQNVMAFHGKKTDQCDLVATVKNYANNGPCCGKTATECWGWGGHPESVFDKFKFSYLPPWEYSQLLTWEEATEEICQNRPFISSLDLADGDRHSVVVIGYSVKHGMKVYDPALNDIIYESSADFFDGESPDYTRFRDTYNIQPTQ
jgi:hypothetical protein